MCSLFSGVNRRICPPDHYFKGSLAMSESVYKVIELVGTSSESWEKAAAAAVERAAQTLRDLRVAEVVELDMHMEDGKIVTYRAKVKVSFKYEEG
jgi:dodecin